jgi:hypothetical protein
MTDKLADHLAYPPRAMKAERAVAELPDFVWGADNIGRVIGLNPRQAHHLLINGDIKCARKVRDRWVANKRALIREFGGTP